MNRRWQLILCSGFWLVLFAWIYGLVSYSQHSVYVMAAAKLATFVFAIIAIIEVAVSGAVSTGEKLLWIIVLILFSLLSCMVYYLMDWRSELLYPGRGKESSPVTDPEVSQDTGYGPEG
ncbi:MAG TPA: PLDc N-terminal domain-containing protein [Chitinophagaceae bacterium]